MSLLDGVKAGWTWNNTPVDASGNGHDATLTGATYNTSSPMLGSADLFTDGIDDYGRVPDHADFNFGSAMSALIWVKGDPQSIKGIFSQLDFGINQRSWLIASGNASTDKLAMRIYEDGGSINVKSYETSIVVLNGDKHLAGFTFDSGTFKLWVDGAEDTTPNKIQDVAFTTLHNSTEDIMMGAQLSSGSPTSFFEGYQDQPILYNRALTAGEWSQHWNGGAGIDIFAPGITRGNPIKVTGLISTPFKVTDSPIMIQSIVWTGSATDGHKASVTDKAGNQLWKGQAATTALTEDIEGVFPLGLYSSGGIYVNDMDSGELYIYVR